MITTMMLPTGGAPNAPRGRVTNHHQGAQSVTTYRTLYLTDRTLIGDGQTWARPRVPSSVTELLTRVAGIADPAGVTVMLVDGVHTTLGLPAKPPRGDGAEHAELQAARAHGWRIKGIDPWMTFWRPDQRHPSIHIGVRPWLRPRVRGSQDGNHVLFDTDPLVEQVRMQHFRNMLGVPYHGANAGLPGIELLRDHHTGKQPKWTPDNWDRIPPAAQVVEKVTDKWTTALPPHKLPYEHSFDARMQFLAAALNAKLALNELRWAGPADLPLHSPAGVLPGFYRVTVPSWAFRDRIPHPLGAGREYGEDVWITGATLELAMELADRDLMVVPDVHEAWVNVGGQVLKAWAGKIRDAVHLARLHKDEILHEAMKDVYKAALGLMRRAGQARVFRPDWQQTVVALARCNQWRKMWREGDTWGRWPVEIHADAIWYAGTGPRPDWPQTFKEGMGLGQYRHEDTRAVVTR